MNARALTILGGVLVVMILLYTVTSRSRSDLDESGGFVDLVEGTLSTDEVFSVRVEHGEDGFRMVKRGSDWVLTSHHDAPANVNKLRTLLGNLETTDAEIRSEKADVLGDYQLRDDQALHLRIDDEAGDPLVDLYVGERSGNGGFVRRAGSDEALRAGHNFLSDFGVWGEEIAAPAHTTWMDLQAFKAERDSVQSIELVGAGGRLALAKEFEPVAADTTGAVPAVPAAFEWRLTAPENFLAKKTVADGILGSVVSMRARDVVGAADADSLAAWGLDDGADRVSVTLGSGLTRTVRFGAEFGDDTVYFRVDGEPLVWAMPSYLKDNIFKDVDALRPE